MKKSAKIAPSDDDVPPFMSHDAGLGAENIGPEDMVWCGDNGELDPGALLLEHGWHPESPIEAILRAIIEAHPVDDGQSDDERLELVVKALLGTRRKRGMDHLDDFDLLCAMARRYWAEWCAGNKNPSVAKIVQNVLEPLPANDPRRTRAEPDSLVRRLRKKFMQDRDLLLARVTLEDDWNSRDTAVRVERVIKILRLLRIEAADARLRRPDK